MKVLKHLTRAEMKKISGGVATSSITVNCGDGTSFTGGGKGCAESVDGKGCYTGDGNYFGWPEN